MYEMKGDRLEVVCENCSMVLESVPGHKIRNMVNHGS